MPNRWNAIVGRLHEESGLQYPQNTLRLILEACINGGLDDVEDVIWDTILQGFLQTCTGKYLDLRGEEIGIARATNETDDSYRIRLFNALSYYLSVEFLKLQGIILYNRESIENNVRLHASSNNPYMTDLYIAIPNTDVAQGFLINDVIYEYIIEWCHKGWE